MATPSMTRVTSSNVLEIGYDAGGGELHVRFRSGGYYVYFDVPAVLFQEFLPSESKGRFVSERFVSERLVDRFVTRRID